MMGGRLVYLWMPVPGGEHASALAAGEGYGRSAFTVPPKRYVLVAERVSAVL